MTFHSSSLKIDDGLSFAAAERHLPNVHFPPEVGENAPDHSRPWLVGTVLVYKLAWWPELFGICALFRSQQRVNLVPRQGAGHDHLRDKLSLSHGNGAYRDFIKHLRLFHPAEMFPISLQFLP
jgi:hypothetical protein